MFARFSQWWRARWVLRALLPSLLFNFRYLPWAQAWRLPILLYKPRFVACRGQVCLGLGPVRFGMVQLGRCMAPIYPNSGFIYENRGGCLVFEGACRIGANSALSIGRGARVVFADDFVASASVKIVSCKAIRFGRHCRLGWDAMVLDTNFHPLFDVAKAAFKPAFGAIEIGDYNWFGNQCVIMHSVKTPQRCIFGLRSVVTRGASFEPFALHGGSPLRVLTRGVLRDYEHDFIADYGNESHTESYTESHTEG